MKGWQTFAEVDVEQEKAKARVFLGFKNYLHQSVICLPCHFSQTVQNTFYDRSGDLEMIRPNDAENISQRRLLSRLEDTVIEYPCSFQNFVLQSQGKYIKHLYKRLACQILDDLRTSLILDHIFFIQFAVFHMIKPTSHSADHEFIFCWRVKGLRKKVFHAPLYLQQWTGGKFPMGVLLIESSA